MTKDTDPVWIEALPRAWAFAFRLTGNERDAERLVMHASHYLVTGGGRHGALLGPQPLHLYFSVMVARWREENATQRETGMRWSKGDCVCQAAGACDRAADCFPCRLRRAVNALPGAQRVPMLLVLVEGLSYEEAADVLALQESDVAALVVTGRAALGDVVPVCRRGTSV